MIFLVVLALASSLKAQSTHLIKCYPSTCQDDVASPSNKDRVTNLYLRNDTCFVNIRFTANCAHEDEPLTTDAQLVNDTLCLYYSLTPQITDTLYKDGVAIYELNTRYNECDCCFEFLYLVRGVPHDSIPIRLNDQVIEFTGK
ncbi:hypothetical protein [Carboxylicivirga taeanensis]|uniref:hypothetical protein n=1 Tax=Carboxylicivirga taeanensis TaxID=1416875 RepID=UPI003F6E365B